MKHDLTGQTIVITGASSGFGRAAALAFAAVLHRTQIEKPPPAAETPGAVRAPMPTGTEVSVGRRHRAQAG